jgi:UDP-glucose-4-epimerase GalE
MARLMVTGGAGYVGSHTANLLVSRGHRVVVYDSLVAGHRTSWTGELRQGDIRDRTRMLEVLSEGFDAVLHFAGLISVSESVEDPVRYHDVNVGGSCTLLATMQSAGCPAVVFSSSAAVFAPSRDPIPSHAPIAPAQPYGQSKAIVENILRDARGSGRLRATCLRYFNAAGAHPDGTNGEAHEPETHLLPLAIGAALSGTPFRIFGTDHDTPDGTCIRDYVHVMDLAEAHASAVEALLSGSTGDDYNLGTGSGHSVLEVLDAIESATGRLIDRRPAGRRPGDTPCLVADPSHADTGLNWNTRYELHDMIAHAVRWHRGQPSVSRRT